MGGYGPPGRETGGGYCAAWFICLALIPLLMLSSCAEPKRIVEAIPIPAERMDCVEAGSRPAIPPEYKIEWTNVSNVLQARQEYNQYVASVRAREGMVAGYVLELEGKIFLCANDAAWLREWQAGIVE